MKTCRRGHTYPKERKQCPFCAAASQKRRYELNPEIRIQQAREWRLKNLERSKASGRRRYLAKPPAKKKIDWERFKENHPLHSIWTGMKNRCYNPNDPNYANYGGRGITVSEDWLKRGGYETFEADMWPRPSPRHTLDRINNDLGYSKGNCKWSTGREQGANRRTSRMITICGKTKSLQEWARETGVSSTAFGYRLRRGWPEERLLEGVHRKKQARLSLERQLIDAVVRMYQVIGDSEFNGKEEIVELLKDLDLFSVVTRAA
jgi:hypothetical protein